MTKIEEQAVAWAAWEMERAAEKLESLARRQPPDVLAVMLANASKLKNNAAELRGFGA